MTVDQYVEDMINSATHYTELYDVRYSSIIFSGPDGLIQVWKDGTVNSVSKLIKANPELTPTNTENIDTIKADAIVWFYHQFDN